MIDMTVKQQVWDEITMKKMYSERQEEPQGVRGGGKYWMLDEKRERIWKKKQTWRRRQEAKQPRLSEQGRVAGRGRAFLSIAE